MRTGTRGNEQRFQTGMMQTERNSGAPSAEQNTAAEKGPNPPNHIHSSHTWELMERDDRLTYQVQQKRR
jgi:hypothetical protein